MPVRNKFNKDPNDETSLRLTHDKRRKFIRNESRLIYRVTIKNYIQHLLQQTPGYSPFRLVG